MITIIHRIIGERESLSNNSQRYLVRVVTFPPHFINQSIHRSLASLHVHLRTPPPCPTNTRQAT
ncbi:hypothetical protein BC567DRAFT_215699 [Phyllosticta citribraziliensis]